LTIQKLSFAKSNQYVSNNGRIHVNKKGWMLRIIIISIMSAMLLYTFRGGIWLNDPILLLTAIIPMHSLMVLIIGWFFFKNPVSGQVLKTDKLVSVIVPVYNQERMIESVIDAIFCSTYKNIEVIVVNDGSKDRTMDTLKSIEDKYPTLKVIDKKNEGKRKAVAAGFYASKGDFVVLIDSDSILDEHAITELIGRVIADPKIGGAVGHVKVWNANTNFLTKCQDVWYDVAFNISKACESVFGSVTCCSGCLAAYRREAIEGFIPYWGESVASSDDRELTSYVISQKLGKNILKEVRVSESKGSLAKYLKESASKYDDAEDRLLTAQTLESWKTVYAASAIVYTDVPEKFKTFLKQQQRWKKGALRTNFFVSSFFWQGRHPLMTLFFYLEFMSVFSAPIIAIAVLFYEPFIRGQILIPLVIMGSTIFLEGLAVGYDYKMRDPTARTWMYRPAMNLITNFVLCWLLFPALWNLRKNNWGTR